MAYTYAIYPSVNKFVFSEFSKNLFKSVKSRIDSKISHIFQKVYERFYGIVQQYGKSEYNVCKNNGRIMRK